MYVFFNDLIVNVSGFKTSSITCYLAGLVLRLRLLIFDICQFQIESHYLNSQILKYYVMIYPIVCIFIVHKDP